MLKTKEEGGNKYGLLTVIKQTASHSAGGAKWECLCECGNIVKVRGKYLRLGHTQSCGHLNNKHYRGAHMEDLTGHRFGNLVVLSQSEYSASARKAVPLWLCQCDCGKTKIIPGIQLRRRTRSCGCLVRKRLLLSKGEAAFNALAHRMKKGAIRRGRKWTIEKEELRLLITQPCSYCGALPTQGGGNGKRKDGRPKHHGAFLYNGLDRIDSSLEYVSGNVAPSCKNCNFAKRSQTVEEFKQWIVRVYRHCIKKEK